MWPWDWLIAAGNAVSGLSQKVVDWVNSIIASVMSWVTNAINSIWSGITDLWRDIDRVWNELVSFVNNVSQQVWNGINHLADTMSRWISGMVNDLWHTVNNLWQWAASELDRLGSLIDRVWNDIYDWVKSEIWDPLYRLYQGIQQWAVQAFNRVWQYIQHPELLVQLVGSFLLHMWLQYVTRFAVVFVRWLMRAMQTMAGEVFDILENVLSNIL